MEAAAAIISVLLRRELLKENSREDKQVTINLLHPFFKLIFILLSQLFLNSFLSHPKAEILVGCVVDSILVLVNEFSSNPDDKVCLPLHSLNLASFYLFPPPPNKKGNPFVLIARGTLSVIIF